MTLGEMLARWGKTRPGHFPTPEEIREDEESMREFVRVGEQLIEKSDRERQGKTLGRAIGKLND